MVRNQIWEGWAKYLNQWGLCDFVAWFLEASGPVHFLGAQAVYIGQPLLDVFIPTGQSQALAELLEKPEQVIAFAAFLRKD